MLRTDWSLEDAREIVTNLELTYDALEKLLAAAFGLESGAMSRVEVVAFERTETFRAITGLSAPITGQARHDPAGGELVVMGGREPTLVAHELTHVFVRQSLWRAPVWVNEGLAGYFSSLELWEKTAVLGRTFPTNVPRYGGLPTLEGLLTADARTFYDSGHRSSYYGAALLLVHMLNDDDPRDRPRFARYISLLRQGTPARAAWQTAFAEVSLEGLTHRLRQYCGWQYKCRTWETPYVAARVAVEQERPMEDFEVRLSWIKLASWDAPGAKEWIGLQLAAVRASHPDHPEALYWMAKYQRRWGRAEEARRLLVRATQGNAREARYWLALAELDIAQAADAEPAPSVLRLAEIAESPDALAFVAHYFGELWRPDEGLPFATRALARAPGCWTCLNAMALLLFEKGRFAEAVEKQRWAADLVPESEAETRIRYMAVLAQYESALPK